MLAAAVAVHKRVLPSLLKVSAFQGTIALPARGVVHVQRIETCLAYHSKDVVFFQKQLPRGVKANAMI